jgi:TonB-dependent receptor
MTTIAGVRVESENNDYKSRYSPRFLNKFPNSGGLILDTTTTFKETVWLPNIQTTLRLTDFMNVRLAAYRALARPDFNSRLQKFVAVSANTTTLTVGIPNLKAAKAWNYEINTSFFGKDLGLLSVSAFYRNITDMYHIYNAVPTKGNQLLDQLGVGWREPFADTSYIYQLTVPFNSSKPTKVWGIEFEHQANLSFLPGFLQNFVLSYNFSLVRSETYQVFWDTRLDSVLIQSEFGDFYQKFNIINIFEGKTRLENQPEFFANVALGYDIDGFSGRISLYHQGEYTRSFTSNGRGDRVVKSYSRLDLSLKQKITSNISVLLNINNLTDTEEPVSSSYTGPGWDLPVTSQKYGVTADFGVRLEL